MDKLAHTLVPAVFGLAGYFTWDSHASIAHRTWRRIARFHHVLRRASTCADCLPAMAAAYCFSIWFRKAERLPSSIVFFAATVSAFVLVTLPTSIAAYLPLLKAVNFMTSH
jgi:hypothetical protein